MKIESLLGKFVLVSALFTIGNLPASGQNFSVDGAKLSQLRDVPSNLEYTRADSSILPTDTLSLPPIRNQIAPLDNFRFRLFQKLPARLFFSSSVETSIRLETNPFQSPPKRNLLHQFLPPSRIFSYTPAQREQVFNLISQASSSNLFYRIQPNVTAGLQLAPKTRFYGNYFFIKDVASKNHQLNARVHSISFGLQQDLITAQRATLQASAQARQLYILNSSPLFDFLPSLSGTYSLRPETIIFSSCTLQLRGHKYFQAPTREIDPFYNVGCLYRKGNWVFSASTTFVQNFRNQFNSNAKNNYAFISDFEIARPIIKKLPNIQAFVRAEPVWNFHSNSVPGLSGMDFRLFGGLRAAVSKPSLYGATESIRKQISEDESPPRSELPKESPTS